MAEWSTILSLATAAKSRSGISCREMKDILGNTYGMLVYQEQIMQLAQKLAGYSLGEADLMRRAMGKKKSEEMAVHEEKFVSGAVRTKNQKGQSAKRSST